MSESPSRTILPEVPTHLTRKMWVFSADDVGKVVQELTAVADKWHEIGSELRLSEAFLEDLKSQEKGAEASLVGVISRWLGGSGAKPTWEGVWEALTSKTVGEEALAETLDGKFSITVKDSDVTTVPRDLSRPFACGIKDCVCEQIINKMTDEAGLVFPYLEFSEEAGGCGDDVKHKLELEYREVLSHYDNFASFVWKGLVRRDTNPQVLVDYLDKVDLFQTFQKLTHPTVKLFTNILPALKACSTLTEVFLALRRHVSVFNHGVMVDVLLNMGGTTRDRNELDKFRDRYYSFMRRKATMFPSVFTAPVRCGYAMVRFTVKKDIDKISLAEADSYCNRLTYNLDVSRFTLKLVGLIREREGVTTYVYQVPWFAPNLMFPMTDEQVAAMRKENIMMVASCSYRVDIPEPDPKDLESADVVDKAYEQGETAMEVEGSSDDPKFPPYASLPPDSPFRIDVTRTPLPPGLIKLQEHCPGTENYVAFIPRASDKTLYAAMLLCQHAVERRKKDEPIRCLVTTNTKLRAHEMAAELEVILPGLTTFVCTGTEKESISVKLHLPQDVVVVCSSGKFYYDLDAEVLKFGQISLLVVDDCQYAMRQTFLESAFHRYIVDRVYRSLKPPLPHIVGLTCSPGERCAALDGEDMLKHLLKVASGVDSKLGIIFTDDVTSDMYTPPGSAKPIAKPTMQVRKFKVRNVHMDIIATIHFEICKWEDSIDLKCPHYKWSAEYSEVVQALLESALKALSVHTQDGATPPELMERVRVLELMQCYVQAIKAVAEFGTSGVVSTLQAPMFDAASQETKSYLTNAQFDSLSFVRKELEFLMAQKSPRVEAVVDVVCAQIKNQKSRGVLFVDSMEDAQHLCGEISKGMFMSRPYIVPRCLVARYATNACSEVEREEQVTEETLEKGREGLEAFSRCESRLLLIPYALEIDAVEIQNIESEFDFVARLHKLTKRDDMVESEHVLSFMLSPSNKPFAELRRDFDMCRVEMGLRMFPTSGELLRKKLTRGMEDVMFSHQSRFIFPLSRNKKKQNEPEMDQIQLRCKKCRVSACHGMDIYTFFVDGGSHCVVPHRDFPTRFNTKPYQTKHKTIKRVNRLQRMFCNNCGAPWGVVCHFPAKGCLLPVIKSKYFVFEMSRKYYAIKLWSDALFRVPPIAAYPEFHIHGHVEREVDLK